MKKLRTIIIGLAVMFLGVFCMSMESEAASAGLYNASGKLVYTWSQLTGDSLVKGGVLKVKDGKLWVTDNYVVTGQYYDEEWECYEDIEKYAYDFLKGKLVISSSVTAIKNNGFEYCDGLTEIVLPNSLKTIGEWAFAGTNITSLHIPKNVSTIKPGIVTGCNKLKKITVASANKSFDSRDNCNAVIKKSNKELVAGCKTTVIPKGTKIIGEDAFRECWGLKKITIPEGVTTLKYGAFSRCTMLEKVVLPSTLKTIEEGVFYFCDFLYDFTIPKSVTKVGQSSFMCVPIVHHQTSIKNTYLWEADKVHKAVAGKCSACGKKITVTFNANGGKVSKKSKTIYNNMTYLLMPQPTRKGYTFQGWYTAKTGGKYVDYLSKSASKSNHTLYARWKAINYKITYNLNGGAKISGKTYPATYTINKAITFPKVTKKGYTFQGWYTDKNFKNKITGIAKGTTGKKTLYAKWKANTYKVAFKANGGSGTQMTAQSFTYDAAKKALKANTYTRKGYKFLGWATSASGKVVYTNKQQVKNLAAANNKIITLYAKWQLVNYKLSYKCVPETAGVSFDANPATYTVNSEITLTAPTLEGYTLEGEWYSDAECTKAVSAAIPKGTTGAKTYYYKIITMTPVE